MSAIRVLFAAILFATASLVTPAEATSFSTDNSDLWWVPAESGWGMQLVQRGSVIFATMFVYDPTGTPIWYTATLNPQAQPFTWSGDLLLTNGPWFGTVPFNPRAVGYRRVGTMTWTATSVTDGTLRYAVDGVNVVKNPTRQTLVNENYSGTYNGATYVSVTGCFNPSGNGSGNQFETFYVTQNGQNVSISSVNPYNGTTITIDGLLSQGGQFGSVSGTYTSSFGEIGNVLLFEMNVQLNTFSTRAVFSSTNTGCTSVGQFGGMRAY